MATSFRASRSALESTNTCTAPVWPLCDAMSSGVLCPCHKVQSSAHPYLHYHTTARLDASWALSYTPPVPWCPCRVAPYPDCIP